MSALPRDAVPQPLAPPTVAAVLAAGVAERPHQEALVDARHRLDYQALDRLVGSMASGFAALGLASGDRVAVSMPNSAHAVATYLGCMRAGLVFVGVHPGLAVPEKLALLGRAQPDLVVGTAATVDPLRGAAGRHVAVDLADATIAELAGPAPTRPIELDAYAPAAIAFTSGTSGDPKGVVHDQHHMVLPASVVLQDRMGGRGERIGVHLPLTTLNVLILGPVLALLGGGTCVCIDGHEPASLAATIERERIDHLSTSPAVVHDLLEHPDVDARRQLARVRLGVGGASCPERLRHDYAEAVGRRFTTGYGLTEAPTAVAQETERVPHRPGASGVAMAHVGIEIVDDEGRGVGTGETGEITVVPAMSGRWAGCFRGMHGYLDRPLEESAGARRLHTGDLGSLDDDGYLYVTDRRTDMINRGGSKVSPVEVERVLLQHSAVADCIVVGRPSERLGETVAAAVELRAGHDVDVDDLRAFCARSLAGYKVPSDVVVVDDLPRSPMGKVIREVVRERLAEASAAGQRSEEA